VETLGLVRSVCDVIVLGNHDEAVASNDEIDVLPLDGIAAALAHRQALPDADRDWLRGLPLRAEAHGCTFVHAAPSEPAAWLRLGSFRLLREQFAHFETDLCFVGHSHVPAVAAERFGVSAVRPGERYLIDVGSVGQPRDGDPRASFGLYDTETGAFEAVRVGYDVDGAAAAIRAAGLPETLAARLYAGR
jgi:diadenosine tetraphosphatase ApaH/serine/threonine PP2A family protein phosphatase